MSNHIRTALVAAAERHGVSVDDILSHRRFQRITAARRYAIQNMRAKGVPLSKIAFHLKMNVSSVEHHVYPKVRERRANYYRQRISA